MRLYAITDRFLLPGPHRSGYVSPEEQESLAALVKEWAAGGVAWVQLREKDLPPSALVSLARRLSAALAGSSTRLVLNGPAEVAVAAGIAGLHLPGSWTPESLAQARTLYAAHGQPPLISVACHSLQEVREAARAGADLALFAPVFGKRLSGAQRWPSGLRPSGPDMPGSDLPGAGLETLAAACRAAAPLPVLALGGGEVSNAAACLRAGAQGIAAIRLFLGDGWRPLAQVE